MGRSTRLLSAHKPVIRNSFLQPEALLHLEEDLVVVIHTPEQVGIGAVCKYHHGDTGMIVGGEMAAQGALGDIAIHEGEAAGFMVGGDDYGSLFIVVGKTDRFAYIFIEV